MQRYESSLQDSSHAIAATPPGATVAAAFGVGGSTTSSGYVGAGSVGGDGSYGRGVPWRQLVGAQPVGSGAVGVPVDGVGAGGDALRNALMAQNSEMSELAAAESAGGEGGMWPGMGARGRGGEDEEHQNRMPTIDQGLFGVDERACTPVIGL
jgi:hypothetical protein